jgi:hypothetical protein
VIPAYVLHWMNTLRRTARHVGSRGHKQTKVPTSRAQRTATISIIPRHLAEALQLTLALTPNGQGQQIAQREIATELGAALDARRQRILVSRAQVNLVKWSCLFAQAVCALLAIALVHSDNRLAATIAMGIFATGVAASVLLILSHDRPFSGQLSVAPDPLLQVMPEAEPVGTKSTRSDPTMICACHLPWCQDTPLYPDVLFACLD